MFIKILLCFVILSIILTITNSAEPSNTTTINTATTSAKTTATSSGAGSIKSIALLRSLIYVIGTFLFLIFRLAYNFDFKNFNIFSIK
jgi:hypothetical protein